MREASGVGLCDEFLLRFEDKSLPKDPVHGHLKYMVQMVIGALTDSNEWLTGNRR